MPDSLPDFIDPLRFVEKHRRLRGSIPLTSMDRLADLLMTRDGYAIIDLEFRRIDRVAAILGSVRSDLVLQCQYCLERLTWPVRSEVGLGVVASLAEAERLPADFEPLMLEPGGQEIALIDLVQDEILLSLPAVARHEQCATSSRIAPKAEPGKTPHPFAALAELLRD